MDRQSPKCWAETLKMSPQVTSNDTAIWEVIFSTWYPGKVSLSAAQRSRSNNQGSISPQTPSTATGAHKANNHRNCFLSHCAWTGRKNPDPGNACYKIPDTLWHELNGLGSHFFLRQMAPSLSWIMPSLCPFTNSLILCSLPNITHWTPNTWYDGLGLALLRKRPLRSSPKGWAKSVTEEKMQAVHSNIFTLLGVTLPFRKFLGPLTLIASGK